MRWCGGGTPHVLNPFQRVPRRTLNPSRTSLSLPLPRANQSAQPLVVLAFFFSRKPLSLLCAASFLSSLRPCVYRRTSALFHGGVLWTRVASTCNRAALTSAVFPIALHTSVTRYSSSACAGGGFSSTRASLGSGVLRRPTKQSRESEEVLKEMALKDDTPTRPRRGRPAAAAGSDGKPARKSAGITVKRSAARTGQRGRPRGSASATRTHMAAAAAATDSRSPATAKPNSGHDEQQPLFSRHDEAPSDKENHGNSSDGDGAEEAQDAGMDNGQYELSPEALCSETSARLHYPRHAVRYVLMQTKEGATVPFLARYRQGETGRMDESQLRQVLDTAKEVREVHRRRQFMLRSLGSRGLLTPALQAALASMAHVSQLEDAWEPYKERRTSLASRGRAEGLGRYAVALLHYNPAEEECRQLLSDLRAAVSRVEDGERLLTAIVAEDVQRGEAVRWRLGDYCRRTTRLTCAVVHKPRKKIAKDMQEESFEHLKKHFAFYDGKAWAVDRIAAHVVLALQRGETKGVLQVETTPGPKSHGLFMHTVREEFPGVARLLPPPNGQASTGNSNTNSAASPAGSSDTLRDAGYCRRVLLSGLQGAYESLLKQLNTAVRRDLKKSAEQEAIVVFAHNLHHMLLQRPLSHSRLLAMDPGHTHGVKCVVLDEHGAVETFFTCTLMDEAKMRQYVTQVVEARKVNKIVIGNGTASGETSELVADLIKLRNWKDVEFAVVSEAGASVYSVSDIAKEEFPTLSVMYRGAVSIGRRVLDPLSELVKIPVRSMGIGMYQHDVNEKELMKELGYVLESCVAKVGINAVSANRYVMEKVPGIQKKIVDQIVLARHAKKLHSRDDLRRVPAMTESVYEQIAGFFRFPNSPEPLDNTNIHPESYLLVRRLMKLYATGELAPTGVRDRLVVAAAPAPSATAGDDSSAEGVSVGDVHTRQDVARALQQLSPAQLAALAAQRLSCTVETLELVRQELLHPGLDPRASLPHAGLLRREVYDVRDLRAGDRLSGVVQSVTMFGAFVDCGLHDSVLVRGDGVDTLQVGAYLHKRIRFDCLDHLKRPRMFLLPDPDAVKKLDAGAPGGPHRLHLESEDRLGSVGDNTTKSDVNLEEFDDDAEPSTAAASVDDDAVAASSSPSLSATILRERKRRAAAESGPSKPSIAAPLLSAPAASSVTPRTVAKAHPTTQRETPPLGANVEQRGHKRPRSSSPETLRTQPHLNVQQQHQGPLFLDHVPVAPLMMAVAKGRAAPATSAMTARVEQHRMPTPTPASTTAKPAAVHGEAIDVDAQSEANGSGSSGSDMVFSF